MPQLTPSQVAEPLAEGAGQGEQLAPQLLVLLLDGHWLPQG